MNIQFQIMLSILRSLLIASAISLCGLPAWGVSEITEVINRANWPQYENGPNVISLPQISKILQKFEENPGFSVEIRYPGGDAGRLWAESLSGWLVAFGIPLEYQALSPGSGSADWLVIALIDRN